MVKENIAYETEEIRVLTFYLDGRLFAIPINDIKEIHRMSTLKGVDNAPPEILGVINFHSFIIPVFHLKVLLGMEPLIGSKSLCITIKHKERFFAFAVDKLHIFINIDKSDIDKVSHFSKKKNYHILKITSNLIRSLLPF